MRPQILTPALLLTSSATWSKPPDLLDLFPCLLNKEDDLGKLWSPFYLLKINCNGWNIQYKHYSNKCIMISLVMAPALGWTQGKVQRRVTTAILNSMNLITGCLSLWAVWACWLCRRTRKHSFSIKLCLFSGPCKHRHDPHNFIFQITERKSSGIFFFLTYHIQLTKIKSNHSSGILTSKPCVFHFDASPALTHGNEEPTLSGQVRNLKNFTEGIVLM